MTKLSKRLWVYFFSALKKTMLDMISLNLYEDKRILILASSLFDAISYDRKMPIRPLYTYNSLVLLRQIKFQIL